MDVINKIPERYKTIALDDWKDWESISTIKEYQKDEVFINEGEMSKFCGFVLSGAFKNVTYTDNFDERIINFGFETDFLASCESYNNQCPSAFSIVAIEPSKVLVVENDALVTLCYKNQNVANFGFLLTQLLMQQHEEHLKILSLTNPIARYQYIMKNHPDLIQKVTLTDLAKYLYISREALSRARKQAFLFSK
ncbi:MAG: Crp/Fnr family transcriptional regulator [Bacteroidota bacterium]